MDVDFSRKRHREDEEAADAAVARALQDQYDAEMKDISDVQMNQAEQQPTAKRRMVDPSKSDKTHESTVGDVVLSLLQILGVENATIYNDAVALVCTLIHNVLLSPNDTKFRTVKLHNKHLKARLMPYPHALAILEYVGFEPATDHDQPLLVLRDPINMSKLTETHILLQQYADVSKLSHLQNGASTASSSPAAISSSNASGIAFASKLSTTAAGLSHIITPFVLTRIPNLSPVANQYCLGLTDMVHGKIKRAVLTNYMFDLEWMVHVLPVLKEIPVVEIVHGERLSHRATALRNALSPNMKAYMPPLPLPNGVHHSKSILLFYETGIRVIICTANFIPIDWAFKSQGIWVRDFRLKDAKSAALSDFEESLIDYYSSLKSVNTNDLRKYDFSTADVHLVASVPGYHKGNARHRYGHMRMRHLLSQEHFPPKFQNASVIAQFSSVGSLQEAWIESNLKTSLTAAASYTLGVDGNSSSGGKASTGVSPSLAAKVAFFQKKGASTSVPLSSMSLKMVFPELECVRNSFEGYAAGGSMPFPNQNYRPWLKSKYLHKWDATQLTRQRAMPHIKTYLRPDPTSDDSQEFAWCLLTSANMSVAAWGVLQKGNEQLCVRHYELGVLFLPSMMLKHRNDPAFSCTPEHPLPSKPTWVGGTDDAKTVVFVTASNQDANLYPNPQAPTPNDPPKLLFPIPYNIHPKPYDPKDEPWVWDREYTAPDIHGQTWNPS